MHRDNLDIMADVLNAVSDGVSKTKIMYKANLSYRAFGEVGATMWNVENKKIFSNVFKRLCGDISKD